MSKKWIDLDQVFFPVGVSSVYFEGRRVSKQDIQTTLKQDIETIHEI